jgi:nitrogen fixation protein FixH
MVSPSRPAAVQTETIVPAAAIPAKPKIESMHPGALQVKSTDQLLTFYGSGFQLPLTVNLKDPSGAAAAPPPAVVEAGPTYFKAQTRLKTGGTWTVQATGPGTALATFAFSVEAPVPAISSVTAPRPAGGATERLVTIDGQFLMPGATVTFTPAAGGAAISKDLTMVSDTQATVMADLPAGQWTVTVTNPGGKPSAAQTFTAT